MEMYSFLIWNLTKYKYYKTHFKKNFEVLYIKQNHSSQGIHIFSYINMALSALFKKTYQLEDVFHQFNTSCYKWCGKSHMEDQL